jgi:multiple sugar transport system permease protein
VKSVHLVELIVVYTILGIAIFAALAPIIWILLTSLKTMEQIRADVPLVFFRGTLQNYSSVFKSNFLNSFLDSLIISLCTLGIAILVGTPAAYALARFNHRGGKAISFWILSMRMAPPFAFVVPFYLIFRTMRWLETYQALVAIYLTFNLSFLIWMLQSFIKDIPVEIEEAAMVDGCSPVQVLWQITIPALAPALAAVSILCFIFSWNEFLFAYVLAGDRVRTVPVAIASQMGFMGIRWEIMCTSSIISILPIVIFTLFVQKYLVRGLTLGAFR